ncbi:MAG: hypothetical protein GX444_00540 [Myxococcales bacterium]|nr:hypothetical protein [Myxococcales bacterium]
MQKPLGEILKEAGLISETHLRAALSEQKRWGGRLGEHLMKAGLITDQQLLDALSHQLGVAKINFRKSHVYLEALKLIPKNICAKYNVIPVAVKNQKGHRKLLLAMSDPTDFRGIQEVEFLSGHSVVTALALESDINRAIDYCYHTSGLRESHGLNDTADVIELDTQFVGTDEEPIIINPEGEFVERDQRINDYAFRALIDLLIEKGVFTHEEFRARVENERQKP